VIPCANHDLYPTHPISNEDVDMCKTIVGLDGSSIDPHLCNLDVQRRRREEKEGGGGRRRRRRRREGGGGCDALLQEERGSKIKEGGEG